MFVGLLLLCVASASAQSCGQGVHRDYHQPHTDHHLCGHHHHGPVHKEDPHVSHCILFNELATDLKVLDDKVKKSCKMHDNERTREIIENNRYNLATPLPGYNNSDFDIKIKGRAIYIKAKNDNNHYSELRSLPTFVDAAKAVYIYIDGTLKIVFAFKNDDDANPCNHRFHDFVVTVPMYKLSGVGPRSDFEDSIFDTSTTPIY